MRKWRNRFNPFGCLMWVMVGVAIVVLFFIWQHIPFWMRFAVGGLLMAAVGISWDLAPRGLRIKEWVLDAHISHVIAGVLVFLGIVSQRSGKRVWRWYEQRREMRVIPEAEPEVATRAIDVCRVYPRKFRSGPLVVLTGYQLGRKNKPVWADLADNHTAVAASTGGGKTTFVRLIVNQLITKPEEIRPEVVIIDLKADPKDRLSVYGSLFRYISDPSEALAFLGEILDGLPARMATKNRPPPMLLVIDEIAQLTEASVDEQLKRAARAFLTRLAQQARSADVHLLFATQYPKFDVLQKSIMFNLLRRIAFRVASPIQMGVIMDYNPAQPFPEKPGEFIMYDSNGEQRGRALWVPPEEAEEALSQIIVSDEDDWRYRLWREVAMGQQVGDTIPGIARMYSRGKFQQTEIRYGYRNLAMAGLLAVPEKSGGAYRILVPYLKGVPMLKEFVERGSWDEEPESLLGEDVSVGLVEL